MAKKSLTQFIQDESQIPEGFIRLASFGHDKNDHRALSDAHRDGKIRAVKVVRCEGELRTGAVWVHEADARSFLSSRLAASPPAHKNKPRVSEDSAQPIAALASAIVELAAAIRGGNHPLRKKDETAE